MTTGADFRYLDDFATGPTALGLVPFRHLWDAPNLAMWGPSHTKNGERCMTMRIWNNDRARTHRGTARVRIIGALLVVPAALGLTVATASGASAASVASYVNLRPCVDLNNANCAPVGTTGAGGGLYKMRCWRDGSGATGAYWSNRWFLVSLADGREGYVHSSFVTQQYATPNCTTLPYVRAADWAIARIGQYQQPNGVAWSGYCATFTYNAFTQGAGVGYPAADAIGQYYYFRNRGLIYGGIPRYGDPVFYNIAQPYGHTAIYVGGTTVVSTQGMPGEWKPVVRRDMYSFSNYLGWALV